MAPYSVTEIIKSETQLRTQKQQQLKVLGKIFALKTEILNKMMQ